MLPSMPLISTPCKEGHTEENSSNDQNEIYIKALDLSLSAKKSSPLKHVTPILRKYNTQRKGKGGKKMGPQCDQLQAQILRPIAPKPMMVVIAPTQDDPQSESGAEVKQETTESSESKKPEDEKKKERKDSEDELAALMRASTTIQSAKGRVSNVVRKKTKQVRDMESSVMLLTPDDPLVREEKSYGFAQAYFLKVKERLEGTELYHAFLHTMNEFGTSIIEVRDLYYKVTSLLSQHPDLSEEFLAFLLPEQAMQCGKLMEYLMITKMRDFFRRLEMYFEKQPHQMRKFYSALSTLCDQTDVSLTDVRSAILPLLKGNSVLIDNFLNLLPEEKPPESMMTEFEDMEIGDCNKLKDDDLFETLVIPNQPDAFGGDSCACNCHQTSQDSKTPHCLSCGTRFIHGKIFLQTGKVLRPAKVEFDTETAYQSMKRLSAKNRPKVRSRKRTTIRFGNSSLKRTHVTSSNSGRNTPSKSSRAGKSKSGQKGRQTKSCRRLVKAKTQNTSKQTSVNSTAKSTTKGSQSRSSVSEKIARNVTTNVAKSVSNALLPYPIPGIVIPPKSIISVAKSCDEIPPHSSTDVIPSGEIVIPPVLSSSDAIPQDESAILPPVVGTPDSDMKDFSSLSSVLQRPQDDSSNQICEQKNLPIEVPEISIKDLSSHSHSLQTATKIFQEETDISPEVPKPTENNASLPRALQDEPLPDGLQDDTFSHVLQVGNDITQFPQKISVLKRESLDVITRDICIEEQDTEMKECDKNLEIKKCNKDTEMKECDEDMEMKEYVEDTAMKECDDETEVKECDEESEVKGCDEGIEMKECEEETETRECEKGKNCVVNKTVNNAWTRDEDKVILQMCKMEHSFQEISEHLPQRSVDEIQTRFEILINIMKLMSEEKMEHDGC